MRKLNCWNKRLTTWISTSVLMTSSSVAWRLPIAAMPGLQPATATEHLGEEAPLEEQRTLEQQVLQFMKSKNIHLESQQISACHVLPRKDRTHPPAIIVRFVNRKHKVEILRQSKKLKNTGVYINEHLTKKNAEIARNGCILRKQDKIHSTWTRTGKVFVRLNGTPERAKVVVMRHLKELDV